VQEDNHLVSIKEEIILYNPDIDMIIGYCVVIERAQYSFGDLFKIWGDKERSA
jgi:hypothetical protein